MKIDNSDFALFLNHPVIEIPQERLTGVLSEILAIVLFQMSATLKNELRGDTINAIIDILRNKFGKYPLHLVATALDQGSLGQLGGTTAFSVRNVFIWLAAMKEASDKIALEAWKKEEARKKKEELNSWKGIQKDASLYGTALYIKCRWISNYMISYDSWEKYSLDKIVNILKLGIVKKAELIPSMIDGKTEF